MRKQLSFPFVWDPRVHAKLSDKIMEVKKFRGLDPVRVYRNSRDHVWAVSIPALCFGAHGICGSSEYFLPRLFYSGRDAWTVAKRVSRAELPLIPTGGTFLIIPGVGVADMD